MKRRWKPPTRYRLQRKYDEYNGLFNLALRIKRALKSRLFSILKARALAKKIFQGGGGRKRLKISKK